MKRVLLVSAFCLLSSRLCADSKNPLAIQAFNEAAQRFNAKQFAQAVPYFTQAVSHDAAFAEAYYGRGACRHHLKQSNQAIADLNEAVRLDPSLLDAFAMRGVVSYETKQWDAAFLDFNYVLSLRPEDAQSLLARGVLLLRKDKVAEAQRDFRAFLTLRPQDAMAPRLRKLLASLGPPDRPAARSEAGGSETIPDRPAAGSYTASPQEVAAAQQIAEDLLFRSHAMSDRATRKALKGEQVQVTGEWTPQAAPVSHTAPPGIPSNGVQIVEP